MSRQAKAKRQQRYKERFSTPVSQYLAVANELLQIYKGMLKQGVIKTPLRLSRYLFKESALESPLSEDRLMELFSDIVLESFNELGPVYGKAAQIALSRIESENRDLIRRWSLDRLYSDWPRLEFSQIEAILDAEIPHWQEKLQVDPYPLGVASMAQVHTARDNEGREWVIKVIKPHANKRLHETLDAVEQLISVAKPLELSAVGRRTIKEMRSLVKAMRHETDLLAEKKNIERMQERLATKKQKVLRLPDTCEEFCTHGVMTVERFRGTSLSDVLSGHSKLNGAQRRKLARKMLQELLVQVFEIGLFHGDPHAGNLILLDDGTLGLFDWGLTGELEESDRRHISSLLRSLMTWDMERLVVALGDIAMTMK